MYQNEFQKIVNAQTSVPWRMSAFPKRLSEASLDGTRSREASGLSIFPPTILKIKILHRLVCLTLVWPLNTLQARKRNIERKITWPLFRKIEFGTSQTGAEALWQDSLKLGKRGKKGFCCKRRNGMPMLSDSHDQKSTLEAGITVSFSTLFVQCRISEAVAWKKQPEWVSDSILCYKNYEKSAKRKNTRSSSEVMGKLVKHKIYAIEKGIKTVLISATCNRICMVHAEMPSLATVPKESMRMKTWRVEIVADCFRNRKCLLLTYLFSWKQNFSLIPKYLHHMRTI